MLELMEISRSHKIVVIEDNAQSLEHYAEWNPEKKFMRVELVI